MNPHADPFRSARLCFAGVLLALLSACATVPGGGAAPSAPTPRYTPPTTGPTARLIMRTQVDGTGTAYAVNVLADSDNCAQRQLIGGGRTGATAVPTVQIAAARLTTIEFASATADKRVCMVRWSFLPGAGRSYLLQSTFDGNRCTSLVLDATNPDAIRPEPSSLRRNSADKACVPLGQAKALPTQTTGSGDATLSPGANTDDLKGLIGR
jgi:hypothetical protein